MGNCCCNIDAQGEHILSGNGLKYALNMTCEGFDINTDDWTVTLTRGNWSMDFTPSNSVQVVVDEGEATEHTEWYICADTADIPEGDVYITYDACVPDDDFEGGIRHELQEDFLCRIVKPKRKK